MIKKSGGGAPTWESKDGTLAPVTTPDVFDVKAKTSVKIGIDSAPEKKITIENMPGSTSLHETKIVTDSTEIEKDASATMPTRQAGPDYPLDINDINDPNRNNGIILGVKLSNGEFTSYALRALRFADGTILFAEDAEVWLRKNLSFTNRVDAYGNPTENEAFIIWENLVGETFKMGIVRNSVDGLPSWAVVDSPLIFHGVSPLLIGGTNNHYLCLDPRTGSFSQTRGLTKGLTYGDATNFLNILPDGTLRLAGSATAWEDLTVPTTVYREQLPAVNAPILRQIATNGGTSKGVYAYGFGAGAEAYTIFDFQLPHAWKEGSAIYPHIHWSPKTNGASGKKVQWRLEYLWANIGDVYATTTLSTAQDHTPADNPLVAKKHYITQFAPIDGTGKTLSSVLRITLSRNTTYVDNYADEAYILGFDFHIEIDSLGSAEEYIK